MRIFIGTAFSNQARRQICRAFAQAAPLLTRTKPASWQGYHLTLQFLGEVPEEAAEALRDRLQENRFETPAFQLVLTGLGRFQKAGGDVLWLGVDPSPPLQALQSEVTRLTSTVGFVPEPRPFSPHLTLARGVRYKEDFEAVRRLWSLPPLTETVSRVTLFHSTRVAGRLSYLPLESASLREGTEASNQHDPGR